MEATVKTRYLDIYRSKDSQLYSIKNVNLVEFTVGVLDETKN